MLEKICDNCMSRVPVGVDKCPKCGVHFENTNPGGALPNGWVLGGRYTIGRCIELDGEGVTYSTIDANTLQRVTVKEFMPVTLCATRDDIGSVIPKPGCEVLFKTTRMDYAELYGILLRLGLVEGLVQVLDVLDENNTAYAVLEKIEGPTLAEYMTKSSDPMDSTRALAMLRPLMIGVETLHTASVIHRGISPENIILESGGTAKLAGFATLALRQQGNELKPKLYPAYSAPEQYAASEFEGRYTDVYAFGAVLYRMLTGVVPEAADERKIQDNMRPAKGIVKEIPSFLSAGIARAMRVTAAERIQSVQDLRLALSGEGGRTAKGPLGLSKQQLIVGASALGAIVVLVLVILIVSLFGGKKDKASSSSSSGSSSVVETIKTVPDFAGKIYNDIIKGTQYVGIYNFGTPTEEFSKTVEEGRIISQTPLANSEYDGKTPIVFVVSKGIEPILMPDFVTTPTKEEDAKKKLTELEIEVTVVPEENDGTKEAGTVLRTTPVAGENVRPGQDKVTLYIAQEKAKVTIPDLTNMSEAEAKAALDRLNLLYSVRPVTNDKTRQKAGRVASTEPAANAQAEQKNTTVTLHIYDKYYMPNLDRFNDKLPSEGLYAFLDEHEILYRLATPAENTAARNEGRVANLSYTVNQEVTESTVVIITLYGVAMHPPVSVAPIAPLPVPELPDPEAPLGPEG